MSNQAPSTNAFVATSSDSIRATMRRRTLAAIVPHLIPLLDALPPGATVCDAGCGPGSITLDIAKRYPHLNVLGVDIEPKSIEGAKADAAAAQISNVKFTTGDATRLSETASSPGFEALNGGCDLIYSHMVLMHLTTPIPAITSFLHSLRPVTGLVSLKEADYGMWTFYPSNPGTDLFLSSAPLIFGARGADTAIGRKLVSHALAAGFERAKITTSVGELPCTAEEDRKEWVRGIEVLVDGAMGSEELTKAAGFGGTEEWERIVKGFREWAKDEGAFGGMFSPVVNCRR